MSNEWRMITTSMNKSYETMAGDKNDENNEIKKGKDNKERGRNENGKPDFTLVTGVNGDEFSPSSNRGPISLFQLSPVMSR